MSKLDSPSAQRNKEPIWNILSSKVIPSIYDNDKTKQIRFLEIAAGCGVHSHHFSLELERNKIPFLWYPSDPDETSRASIQAYLDDEPILKDKLQSPLEVTLTEEGPIHKNVVEGMMFDCITCINMIHISPWSATLGLMKLAEDHLYSGGILYLYGPYKVNGSAVASNMQFDQSLRSRDPSWGVRNLEDVLAAAEKRGLEHVETIEMPANNLSVILRKR